MDEANQKAVSMLPPGSNPDDYLTKESLYDLDGVSCEPTEQGSTRWNFHCDGAAYPARLVNLPCPVELHKTHDHAMYYKSCDVAQMLVVYEDEMAMEEAEAMQGYKIEEFPSYYHSGLTPPLKRVVERRFLKRDIRAVPPPRTEVMETEEELRLLIERVTDTKAGAKAKSKTSSLTPGNAKPWEQVEDELVDYQPWMDDHGRKPNGIEISTEDLNITKYPELWLSPRQIQEIVQIEAEKEDKRVKAAAAKKEEKKAKKKKLKDLDSPSTKKKGISASMKAEIDEVTQAAMLNLTTAGGIDDLDGFDIDDPNFLMDLDDDALDLGEMDFSS